jgi:hypothetical protein
MSPETPLETRLLSIEKVAGVSMRDDHVIVYCEDDSDALRDEVRSVAASLNFKGRIEFEVTGPFEFL